MINDVLNKFFGASTIFSFSCELGGCRISHKKLTVKVSSIKTVEKLFDVVVYESNMSEFI
jgi:hypothetical protein